MTTQTRQIEPLATKQTSSPFCASELRFTDMHRTRVITPYWGNDLITYLLVLVITRLPIAQYHYLAPSLQE
jgi:hypothetical protein